MCLGGGLPLEQSSPSDCGDVCRPIEGCQEQHWRGGLKCGVYGDFHWLYYGGGGGEGEGDRW